MHDGRISTTHGGCKQRLMAPATDQELLLRIDAAADRLSISRATLYRMIQRGEIATIRIGSAVRIPVTALDRWLAAQTVSPPGSLS